MDWVWRFLGVAFVLLLLILLGQIVLGIGPFGSYSTANNKDGSYDDRADSRRGSLTPSNRKIEDLKRRRAAEEAARKQQFQERCAHKSAAQVDWGGGYRSCHRQGGVKTYIDGKLVEQY